VETDSKQNQQQRRRLLNLPSTSFRR